MSARAYRADKERRKELLARERRGEPLTVDEEAFLLSDPGKTRKSAALDRWRRVKTLIVDESTWSPACARG